MAKLKLEFDGLLDFADRIEAAGGSMKQTTESALKASFEIVQSKVKASVSASKFDFNHTGETKGSIRKTPKVEWKGNVAKVGVGYDIVKGGLPSIFLMYGTPRITPDRNLYNAIYGAATKKAVKKVQQEAFEKRLERIQKG